MKNYLLRILGVKDYISNLQAKNEHLSVVYTEQSRILCELQTEANKLTSCNSQLIQDKERLEQVIEKQTARITELASVIASLRSRNQSLVARCGVYAKTYGKLPHHGKNSKNKEACQNRN